MSDVADKANDLAEFYLNNTLQNMQDSPGLAPRGTCHNCREPLRDDQRLFCDKDCADDYERFGAPTV